MVEHLGLLEIRAMENLFFWEILEFTSKEAAAPLMSLAAPLWFFKILEKKLKF